MNRDYTIPEAGGARFDADATAMSVPRNLPTGDIPLEKRGGDDRLKQMLSLRAREEKCLISDDAMKLLISSGNYEEHKSLLVLSRVISDAEEKYVKEDGWILLNREKMQVLLQARADTFPSKESTFVYRSSDRAGAARSGTPSTHESALEMKEGNAFDNAGFVRLLADGDRHKIISYLRALKQGGKSVESFVKAVIYDLDIVYRSRMDDIDEKVPEAISSLASRWTNEELEKIISILVTIIDQSYKSSATGIKLAAMRIADLKK